jgi:hypothetical protein
MTRRCPFPPRIEANMVRHPIALLTSIALAGCGGSSLPPASGDTEPTRTAQANLLLYPSSEPEALLGRAVHQTGDNVWTLADARAPGCDVSVKRAKSPFKTSRQADISSMTTVAGGLPKLIEIAARYGRSVTAEIEIDNTEVLEANVSPRCGDVVVDRVFVGSGRRQLVTQSELGGNVDVQAVPGAPSAGHTRTSKVVDETAWTEPMAYGFGTRQMGNAPPLDLAVKLPAVVQEGQPVDVTIETSHKAWLVVFYQESDGRASVLWPSAEEPEPTSEPGRPASLPSPAEKQAGIRIEAALREPGVATHELFVVYAFTDKMDWDRFKPLAGAESTDGPVYVSELTQKIGDLPMVRWSRAVSAYTIVPKAQ